MIFFNFFSSFFRELACLSWDNKRSKSKERAPKKRDQKGKSHHAKEITAFQAVKYFPLEPGLGVSIKTSFNPSY